MSRTSGPWSAARVRRVAMVSLHTSPLEPPGSGDAGGMNVYVVELAKRLADRDVEVDVFTRATSSDLAPAVEAAPGVVVRHVPAGPFERLSKDLLPSQTCDFSREVLRTAATMPSGHYDLVHSHYWLSGQVGAVVRDRWGVPLVHSMHTLAKVKNHTLADGDPAEPVARVVGEEQVVRSADVLIANTAEEAAQLQQHYAADPARVRVVHPGVDLDVFAPRPAAAARLRVGVPRDAALLVFVGRIQPLKAPDLLIRAAARMVEDDPSLQSRLVVAVVGGPSGSGMRRPEALVDLAVSLGIAEVVRFVPPVGRAGLVDWFAAADAVCVPSYSESFGLVALEAQAVGTPVVAAAVGGLSTAVADGRSGILVPGRDPADYARALSRVLHEPGLAERLSAGAREHASGFGWDRTAADMLDAYGAAVDRLRPGLVEVLS